MTLAETITYDQLMGLLYLLSIVAFGFMIERVITAYLTYKTAKICGKRTETKSVLTSFFERRNQKRKTDGEV